MKNKLNFMLVITIVALLTACSEKSIPDPPLITDKWLTVYDDEAKGISESWFTEFPTTNFSGSTWDDWQMPNARYRWHKQRFRTGEIDSTATYTLQCSTVASPALIWLNGKFLEQIAFTESCNIDISGKLIRDDYNELIIRNEKNDESFGINKLTILKNEQSSSYTRSKDFHSMPMYHELPSYADDLIIYEAFLRHFSGGNFTAMQNMSSRLDQLGINMVRLLPIHPIGRSNRTGALGNPYAVRDYFTTNSRLGSMTQFSSLRSMLHRNRIKLMLDAPIAFSAVDNSWVRDYKNYYKQDENGNMMQPPGYRNKDIYVFDLEDPSLRVRLFSYFDFWLDQGVDAFRLDNSENMPKDFFQELRDHLTKKGEDPLLVADGTKAEHVLFGLDAVDGDALYEAFLDISDKQADATLIGKTLDEEIKRYPAGTKIIHYAENHETNRAMSELGVNDHHLALFTIFTAPGIPMILCGEELNDPPKLSLFDKTDINWYNIHWPTYNLISKLSKFRMESSILTRGDFHRIADTKTIGGFSRRYRNETWFILMNYSNREQNYQIDVKSTVFSDGESGVERPGRVKLKAKGYCIVK